MPLVPQILKISSHNTGGMIFVMLFCSHCLFAFKARECGQQHLWGFRGLILCTPIIPIPGECGIRSLKPWESLPRFSCWGLLGMQLTLSDVVLGNKMIVGFGPGSIGVPWRLPVLHFCKQGTRHLLSHKINRLDTACCPLSHETDQLCLDFLG